MFEYECPYCGETMTGSFGDDVTCNNCNIIFETDNDGDYDSWYSWLTGKETKI